MTPRPKSIQPGRFVNSGPIPTVSLEHLLFFETLPLRFGSVFLNLRSRFRGSRDGGRECGLFPGIPSGPGKCFRSNRRIIIKSLNFGSALKLPGLTSGGFLNFRRRSACPRSGKTAARVPPMYFDQIFQSRFWSAPMNRFRFMDTGEAPMAPERRSFHGPTSVDSREGD
jgi:hypothetical protein